MTLIWRTSAVFAMLAIAVLGVGTAHAQSALPGDTFYGWKRTSEKVWLAFSTDRVDTEITISNRRISELIAVSGDPVRSASAMDGYLESLNRLKSIPVTDEATLTRIVPVLQSQHQVLKDAGMKTTELDNYLVVNLGVAPTAEVTTQASPPTNVQAPPPTDVASGSNSTQAESSSSEPSESTEPSQPSEPSVSTSVPTEPEATSVPTEPPPSVIPTEPEPTSVPTEPPPTSVATEPPAVSTPEPPTDVPPPTDVQPTDVPAPTDVPGNAPILDTNTNSIATDAPGNVPTVGAP
jgi:hypothetical protein